MQPPTRPRRPSRQRSPSGRWLVRHLLPAAAALAFALPVLLLLLGSLRPLGAPPPTGVEVVPPGASLQAFALLDDLLPVRTFARNSALVAVVAVPLTVAVAALAGFGIRLLTARLRRVVVLLSVLVLLIPASALWTTRFQVYAALGLTGSVLPLIAPALLGTTPFFVLVYAWAFHGIADSQLEAARLAGESWPRVLRHVALPQVRPATVAVAVLAFTFHWGNVVDALLYLRDIDDFTLARGLETLTLLQPTEFPLLLAGAVVFTLPSVVVFLLAHRLFDHDPLASLRSGTS